MGPWVDIGHVPFFGIYLFPNKNKNDVNLIHLCFFFLTWVGSYENHCYGLIQCAHFTFQVGYLIMELSRLVVGLILISVLSFTRAQVDCPPFNVSELGATDTLTQGGLIGAALAAISGDRAKRGGLPRA